MKKSPVIFGIICMMILSSVSLHADGDRQLRKDIKAKATKQARKEASKLKKEGWTVNPGSLPMDKTVEKAWTKQYSEDDKGMPLFITADGNGVAQSKSVAEMQAIELAKLQLAGLVETNISSLITANMGNAQLSREEAASVTEIVQSAKNIIATQLGYIDPVFKIYRNVGSDNVEVQVRIFYDRKQSMDIAKKAVKKELREKLKMNEEQLNKLMGIE
ncbi:MAG: hypothetical protein ACJ75J_05455 [Cytophagaceae bacterium]